MSAPAIAFEAGQIVPITNYCKGEDNILTLSRADMDSTEEATATWWRMVGRKVCFKLPFQVGMKLERLIFDYMNSDGRLREVWSVKASMGEWFVILVVSRLPLNGRPPPPAVPGSVEA